MTQDEDFPNHKIEPEEDFTNENELPVTFTFPPNSDSQVIVLAEYDSDTGGDLLYTVETVTPPGGWTFSLQILRYHEKYPI